VQQMVCNVSGLDALLLLWTPGLLGSLQSKVHSLELAHVKQRGRLPSGKYGPWCAA
jgi:hypothetical protein